MKTHEAILLPVVHSGLTSLVDVIIGASNLQATKNNNQLINDVPKDLMVDTNVNIVSSIIGKLVQMISAQASNSQIKISAKVFNKIVIMHIKDCYNSGKCILSNDLQVLQPMIEKIHGFVDVTSYRNQQTTIAFSFANTKS